MKSTARANPGSVQGKMKSLDFKEIAAGIAAWKFPEGIDGVVAIASEGIVPGALVAQRLGVGLKTISISYRNEVDEPQFAQPKLLSSVPGVGGWKRILLVDDVYITGKSWNAARDCLPKSAEVLPFVLVGDVDFALFRTGQRATQWPWTSF